MRRRGLTTAALAALACAGCGTQTAAPAGSAVAAAAVAAVPSSTAYHAHPQAIEPVAGATGAAPAAGAGAATAAGASVSVTPGPAGAFLAAPLTVTDIRHELARSGMSASPDQATLTSGGLAVAPIDAPAAVQAVIAAGNQIARLPYRWGGGHMTYEDTAYDCSGSISYVFAAAHLLDHTVVSGQLANWGARGPGKWITVFANGGHTFMYVAGLRFDTVALAETGTRWSNRSADESNLSSFSVRHPPGL